MDTTFTLSSRKSYRIKFLIEELPTVEHIKKHRPDIYDGWKCPICENADENFTHIWTCPNHMPILCHIVIQSKQELIDLIRQMGDINLNTNIDLNIDNIWDVNFSTTDFTFIDLLKGIIPNSLSSYINSLVSSKKDISQKIIELFVHRLQDICKERIWKPRCDKLIEKEKEMGINIQEKKKRNNSNVIFSHNNIDHNNLGLDIQNYGLIKECRLGSCFLNFILIVNHPI